MKEISHLIGQCLPDPQQQHALQVITQTIWRKAFEAGFIKGMESTDPMRPAAPLEATLEHLTARATLARDGALMREAAQMIAILANYRHCEPSKPSSYPLPAPASLRVAAINGQLVMPEITPCNG